MLVRSVPPLPPVAFYSSFFPFLGRYSIGSEKGSFVEMISSRFESPLVPTHFVFFGVAEVEGGCGPRVGSRGSAGSGGRENGLRSRWRAALTKRLKRPARAAPPLFYLLDVRF